MQSEISPCITFLRPLISTEFFSKNQVDFFTAVVLPKMIDVEVNMKQGAYFDQEKAIVSTGFYQDELIIAVKCGNTAQIIELVKNKKVDINNTDSWGFSPLMVAVSNKIPNCYQTISTLLEQGADTSAQDITGDTAIMMAYDTSNSDAIKALNSYNVRKSFGLLPDEIFSKVLGFLPAYSFKGMNSINQVANYFSEYLKINSSICKGKSIQEVVDSCTNQQDAINILSDESIIKELNHKNLLDLISFIPDLAIKLIDANNFLDGDDLVELTKNSKEIVQAALRNYRFCNVLLRENIVQLVAYHPDLLEYILNNSALKKSHDFESEFILQVVKINPILANNIRNLTGYAGHLVDYESYIAVDEYNSSAVHEIFKDGNNEPLKARAHQMLDQQAVGEKLSLFDSIVLAALDVSLANRIFEFQAVDLDNVELIVFGILYESIAIRILQNRNLYHHLSYDNLFELAMVHEKAAMLIIDTPDLYTEIMISDLIKIGTKFEAVASRLLDDHEIVEDISGFEIALMCRNHAALSKKVLHNEQIYQRFNAKCLITIAGSSYSNALYILNNPLLCSKLDEHAILFLGSEYYPVAQNISETELKNMGTTEQAHIQSVLLTHNLIKGFLSNKKLKPTKAYGFA